MFFPRFFALLFFALLTSTEVLSASYDLPAGFHRLAERVAAREEVNVLLSRSQNRLMKRNPRGKILPLPNGFPNPSASAAAQIQVKALGTLPNGPLPSKLTEKEKTSMQLVALNELFEVSVQR